MLLIFSPASRFTPSQYSEAGAAAYASFKTHAVAKRIGATPGTSLQGGVYASLRAGLLQVCAFQPGYEDNIVNNYMRKTWGALWIEQGDKNKCHTEGCTNPIRDGGNRGGTEVTGGMRNILAAVDQLYSEGDGVDLKLVIDSVLDVGKGKITRFLCTHCNPHGGQAGRKLNSQQSIDARPALMNLFRLRPPKRTKSAQHHARPLSP
jgi:hypothetical protein